MSRTSSPELRSEFLRKVIAPRVVHAITTHSPHSQAELLSVLAEHCNLTVTQTTLNAYLKALGITQVRTTTFHIPAVLLTHPSGLAAKQLDEPLYDASQDAPLPLSTHTPGTTPLSPHHTPQTTVPHRPRLHISPLENPFAAHQAQLPPPGFTS